MRDLIYPPKSDSADVASCFRIAFALPVSWDSVGQRLTQETLGPQEHRQPTVSPRLFSQSDQETKVGICFCSIGRRTFGDLTNEIPT